MSKITGKSIRSSIQLCVDGYSDEVRQAERQLNAVRNQISNLVDSQEQQLLSIGKVHLAEMIARRVQGCTPALHQLNQRRDVEIGLVEGAFREARERSESLRLRAEEADQVRFRALASLDETYASNPDLKQAKREAQEASLRSDADRRASEAALSESWNKLSSYNSSAAFMHLLNRNFGTPEYVGSLLFAWGDRWLAGKIAFDEAKANYQYLQGLPEVAKEAANASLKAKEAANSKVARIKLELELASGVSAADKARDKAHADFEMGAAQMREFERRINEFSRLRDPQYAEMLERLKGILSGMSYEELRIFVTATPTTEDDVALQGLLSDRRTLQDLRAQEIELKSKVDQLEASYQQAKKLIRHFESQGYDAKRRIYNPGFDVDALMTGYVLGNLNQRMLDNMVLNSSTVEPEPQAYTPPPSYSEPSRSSESGSSWSNNKDDDDDRRRNSKDFSNADTFGGSNSSNGYSNSDQF